MPLKLRNRLPDKWLFDVMRFHAAIRRKICSLACELCRRRILIKFSVLQHLCSTCSSLYMTGVGPWRSLVSASVWGTEGREFESRRPDHSENAHPVIGVGVSTSAA